MIENEVSQHVIEGTAGMRQFKAEVIQKEMLALVTCSYGSRDERTICFAVAEK